MLGIFFGYVAGVFSYKPKSPVFPKQQIDSIQIHIDSITTRIDVSLQKVDSIKKLIVYIDEDYSKLFDDPINFSDSINYLFFSDYIECFNNKRTTQDCEPDIFRTFQNAETDSITTGGNL